MAVVTTKAAGITNRDSSPQVKINSILGAGVLREAVGKVEIANGDSIASRYVLCEIPSNARVSQVLVYSDDVGTTTVADFGLYQTTANGGAVADVDFFASALVLNAGALNGTDITYEAANTGVTDPDACEKFVWQALGLSADPKLMYDVCATLTAAADGAGTLSIKVRYVV